VTFAELFQASPLPLVITTEDSGEILDMNAAAESQSGWTAAQVRGKTVYDFGYYQSPNDRAAHIAPLADQPVLTREVQLETAGGKALRLLAHTSRIALDERPCLLTALTNITALGRIEEGLLYAQRMEVVGKLSGRVGHEFNNLLTVMQGHLDALVDELGPTSPLLHRVETLQRMIGEATHVTADLLTFAGRNPSYAATVDLNVALRALAPIVEATVGETIVVTWDLSATPAPVTIDQGHLAQLMLSLASNAREAMPGGGELVIAITFAARSQGGDGAGPEPWVVLRVADTGHGMSDEVLRHAFEPFFTTKGKGHGTGLGLSICRGIAKSASGHITATSTPGRGTTLQVYLPSADPGANVPADQVQLSLGPQGRVVLLVEDEVDVRNIVAELLRRAGYIVHPADGVASTQLILDAAPGRIDLLLTDLVLPGGGGLEVARRVLAAYPAVPVLYMSGYSESVFTGSAQVEHLLRKPFASRTLLDAVRSRMGHA